MALIRFESAYRSRIVLDRIFIINYFIFAEIPTIGGADAVGEAGEVYFYYLFII